MLPALGFFKRDGEWFRAGESWGTGPLPWKIGSTGPRRHRNPELRKLIEAAELQDYLAAQCPEAPALGFTQIAQITASYDHLELITANEFLRGVSARVDLHYEGGATIDIQIDGTFTTNIAHIMRTQPNLIAAVDRLRKSDARAAELKRKNKALRAEIAQLREQIEYQPNGPGYERAKEHFDSSVKHAE